MGRGGRHLPHWLRLFNKVVWGRFFALNPDIKRPELQTKYGMYEARLRARRRADELGA